MPTQTQPPPLDFDAATLINEHYNVSRALDWVVIQYQGTTGTYEIQGYANGEKATCDCTGYRRWRSCKHAAALPEFVAAIERQRVSKLPTSELQARLAQYEATPNPTYRERVGYGAVRAVLAKRGVRLADPAAAVARGRAALDELFGEGA